MESTPEIPRPHQANPRSRPPHRDIRTKNPNPFCNNSVFFCANPRFQVPQVEDPPWRASRLRTVLRPFAAFCTFSRGVFFCTNQRRAATTSSPMCLCASVPQCLPLFPDPFVSRPLSICRAGKRQHTPAVLNNAAAFCPNCGSHAPKDSGLKSPDFPPIPFRFFAGANPAFRLFPGGVVFSRETGQHHNRHPGRRCRSRIGHADLHYV